MWNGAINNLPFSPPVSFNEKQAEWFIVLHQRLILAEDIQSVHLSDSEEETAGRQKLTQEEWKQVDHNRRWSLAGEDVPGSSFLRHGCGADHPQKAHLRLAACTQRAKKEQHILQIERASHILDRNRWLWKKTKEEQKCPFYLFTT